MRQGHVFRRCTRCRARVPAKVCPRCGSEAFSWTFQVDTAPAASARRRQVLRGGFPTKAAAVEAMNRLQAEKAAGTYVAPSRLTVAGYLEDWLATTLPNIRRSTWTTYRVAVRSHIAPRLGSLPLQQLTRSAIKALYAELGVSGRLRGTGGGLSPKSVHLVHLCLHVALKAAVADGVIRSNPADGAHVMPADSRPEMQFWTAEEVAAFLASVSADRQLALWRLAVLGGLRRGEVLGLRWADVDLDAGRLAVRQQLTRQGQAVVFGPPKTRAGRRAVALDPGTVAALRAHRSAQAAERLLVGPAYRDDDLVFCRPDGHPHDPDVLTRQFRGLVRRAGLRPIRFHDLRHTAASLLLAAGVHPKVAAERLGHSSVAVTMDRYTHITASLQNEAAARAAALVDAPAVPVNPKSDPSVIPL